MYSSKNILEVYLIKYFWAKNSAISEIFNQKMNGLPPVLGAFFVYFAGWGLICLLKPPSPQPPGPGIPSANSRHTKQFLSCLHSL